MASFTANPAHGELALSNLSSVSTTTPVTFSNKKIIVPHGTTKTIDINIRGFSASQITEIAISNSTPSATTSVLPLTSAFQPVPNSGGFIRAKKSGTTVTLEDTNTSSHKSPVSYNFWVKIAGTWYDPEIENLGSG